MKKIIQKLATYLEIMDMYDKTELYIQLIQLLLVLAIAIKVMLKP